MNRLCHAKPGVLLVVAWCLGMTASCSGTSEPDEQVDRISQAEDRVDAPTECQDTVSVGGVGDVNMEDYLAGVVACESPTNAPLEARKAQAIAARTYTYRYLGNHSSICNSQSCQVYSCSYRPNGPSAADYQAVRETSGMVLTNGGKLTCPFYVAGDPNTAAPDCQGEVKKGSAANGYEKFVTYNKGKSGADASPSKQGSASNPDNRGSMSQNGAACLAEQGQSASDILMNYYDNALAIQTMPGGDCGELPQNCFGNDDKESCGANVCSWNGDGYCCRNPGFGGELCFSDGECGGGMVCAFNGEDFVCAQPRCDEQADAGAGTDTGSVADSQAPPGVVPDDTRPQQDDTHRPGLGAAIPDLSDPLANCSVATPSSSSRWPMAWVLVGGVLLLRRRRQNTRRAAVVAAAAAMLACGCSTSGADAPSGSSATDGGGGGGASGQCEELTAESFKTSSTTSLFAISLPNKGGTDNDFLSIEFFPPKGQSMSTGTYDLSKEANYATCKHCVRLDQDDKAATKRVFFASSGTLELTATGLLPSSSAGKLSQLRLVEVSVDPSTYATTPVAGGACYVIASASWDTRTGGSTTTGDGGTDKDDGGGDGGTGNDSGVVGDGGSGPDDTACLGLNDCQNCCVTLHHDAALVLAAHARNCLCDPDVCQSECETTVCAAVPATADAECEACAQLMFAGSSRCADEVPTTCEQDPSCAPVMACLTSNECAFLP